MSRILAVFLWVLGAGSAVAGTVSGTVGYRERIALPPDAQLFVELLDVSLADAPSVTLASKRYAMTGTPFPFSLDYDEALIREGHTYTVSARIEAGGAVLFRSTTAHPVLTRGAPETVEITVERMPAIANALPLVDTSWQMFELTGRMLVADPRPTIAFLPGGRVAVDTGCNRFNGGLEAGGNTLTFTPNMAGTLMACPPEREKLEKDILAALTQVSGYQRAGDTLSLTNAAGVTVMRLSRDG